MEFIMPVYLADYLKLASLLFFGVWISLRDMRERKIRNRDLLVMAAAGLALSLVGAPEGMLPYLALNFGLSLAVGFAFWKMGMWGAGDGKLLAALSLFLPWRLYGSFFPAQLIVYNTFLLAFAVWFPSVVLRTGWSEKREALKKAFQRPLIVTVALAVFGLFWAAGKALSYLGVDSYFIYLVFSMSLYYAVSRAMQKGGTFLLASLSAGRLLLDSSVYSVQFVLPYLVTLLVILFIYVIGALSFHVSYDCRHLGELMPGDVPIGVMNRQKSRRAVGLDLLLRRAFGASALRIKASGFEGAELARVRKIGGIDGFLVRKRVAFVPIFFVAAIVTSLIGRDVFLFLLAEAYSLLYE